MAGKTLEWDDILLKDKLGCQIAIQWSEWHSFRQPWMAEVAEVRQYIYATSTRHTANHQAGWRNSTTIPKLTQIRDNLLANYNATLFPTSKPKFVKWQGATQEDSVKQKAQSIEAFVNYLMQQQTFKSEIRKCLTDYVEYGNCFASIEFQDERVQVGENEVGGPKIQAGFVGPTIRRWDPKDIVFNPIAPSFRESPKIVRSIVTLGELKKHIQKLSAENKEEAEALFQYFKDIRTSVHSYQGESTGLQDKFLEVDGFGSYTDYLRSNYCEILTFYGDIYDPVTEELLENHVVVVADRHKVISKKPNASWFGYAPFFHTGWRKRSDNLWAMGPLNNLVGMQYRIDHIENLKADSFDFIAAPLLSVTGYVPDFEWKPFTRVNVGEEGKIEMVAPPFQVLQNSNMEIQGLMALMEEMAGSPKEAMGFRTPGEKTKYEVQRLENAASRIFQSKTSQFEEEFLEPLLNGLLESGRRNLTSDISIRVFSTDDFAAVFETLTPEDITGAGRIRPVAARHFAEQAEQVQNLNALWTSPLGQNPNFQMHWSMVKLAKLHEELLDLSDYGLVTPNIGLSEQADAQKQSNVQQEGVAMEAMTPSGISPDDVDMQFGA